VINAGDKWLYLSMPQQLRMLTTGDHVVIKIKGLEILLEDEFQRYIYHSLISWHAKSFIPIDVTD
jgi:hypothetical protein